MKKGTLIFVFLLLLFTAAAAAADTGNPVYAPEFIARQETMLANAEQTFPRLLYTYTFDIPDKPSVSKPGDGFYLSERNNKLSRQEVMLSAYKPGSGVREWGTDFFSMTGSYENFYLGVDVWMVEHADTADDYFWIRYTNEAIVGKNRSAGAEIAFPLAVRKFETGAGGRSYTNYCDLSGQADFYGYNRIEMTRLNGYTSVFMNGHFIAGFEDGLSGRFYQAFGAGLGPEQGYITVEFDNFVLRTTRN